MKQKIKYKFLGLIGVICLGAAIPIGLEVQAADCPDVRIVFARGSGGERWKDKNYLEFKNTIENKLKAVSLKYEFVDLDYPAVGVGIDNLGVTIGAVVGAGEAYGFGRSVNTGVNNLVRMVNNNLCRDTKYVLGGYSQGAMVVSKALASLAPEKIIYAATFGDPKIYLPEGRGAVPIACSGKGLSDYRMYVPDCRAYKGKLGGYVPYRPESLAGKVGTWCNKMDFFCSSWFDMGSHTTYVADELYADASKVIFDKICKAFGIKNRISSPHDTAILIDSTGSMGKMINRYKAEALRLAKETLASGGRVALFEYRDLDDPYSPREHCNFETCTIEVFQKKIEDIRAAGGGDESESMLSAAFFAMNTLNWKFGATKSMVVLTDAPFLMPDRDGVTLDEVVRLSKEIDPVNFYVITKKEHREAYLELAERTDGMVVTDFDKLELLTDYILDRYDSLPRVEENNDAVSKPVIEIIETQKISDTEYRVKFETSGEKTILALNDWILGETNEREIIVNGLESESENYLTLVPIVGNLSGDSVTLKLSNETNGSGTMFIPKAPNTGRR